MQERRSLERQHLTRYLDVTDERTGQVIGHLIDITAQGILVLCENKLESDTVYRLRVELPGDVQEQAGLVLDALCIRSKEDVNPGFYSAGFRLQNVSPQQAERIRELIDKLAFRG